MALPDPLIEDMLQWTHMLQWSIAMKEPHTELRQMFRLRHVVYTLKRRRRRGYHVYEIYTTRDELPMDREVYGLQPIGTIDDILFARWLKKAYHRRVLLNYYRI